MSGERGDRERVLEATDIVGLVGDAVSLKKKGREWIGLCPFHDDHNPSMYVVPGKQIFHCFTCGASGNAIDFAMKYYGLEFVDALKMLAERSGMELTRRPKKMRSVVRMDGAGGSLSGEGCSKGELAEAAGFAQGFFKLMLGHEEHGEAARAVLARRGMGEDAVARFGIGASPDRWDGLAATVQSKGMDTRAFVEAGLLKRREDGSCYDALRNRLVFPISDVSGRVVAFGGRRIDEDDEPKYLNSPESSLFDKGSTLYGLNLASRAIAKEGVAVVVEGYTDVIACHAAGFEHVVGTLGTALTARHARALRRLCNTVVLLFDSDEAGQRAAERACGVCLGEPFDVRVVVLEDGKDPDEYLKNEDGRARFAALLAGGVDAVAFRFGRLRAKMEGLGSAARSAAVEAAVVELVEQGYGSLSPIRKRGIVRELAVAARVDEGAVLMSLKAAIAKAAGRRRVDARGDAERAGDAVEGGVVGREPRGAAEHALACLVAEPGLVKSEAGGAGVVFGAGALAEMPLGAIAAAVRAACTEREGATTAGVIEQLGDDAAARAMAGSFAAFAMREYGDAVAAAFADCVERMGSKDGVDDGGATDDVRARLAGLREMHARMGDRPRASVPLPIGDV